MPGADIRTVIAHSTADAHSLPVRVADESICVGPNDARGSYLNIAGIISAAVLTEIHPGYGFLAENVRSSHALCAENSLTFIGPSPEAIEAMGDKLRPCNWPSRLACRVCRAPGASRMQPPSANSLSVTAFRS